MTSALAGRTAFVTGASRGIGRSIALGLAREGADLAIGARDITALQSLATEIEALGRKAHVIEVDVMDPAAIRSSVDSAISSLGQLDIMVNNAGGNGVSMPLVGLRPSGWDKTMRLNLDSVMHYCQTVAAHMLERGSGSIINVASVAGLKGTPFMAHYAAAKAGVISLTKTLALELGHSGVRVNALCPGWIETDLTEFLHSDSEARVNTANAVPMQRWGQPEEMVGPAVFLASDASSYVTGCVLVADGGLSLT